MAVEREKFYECEVKRRRVRASGGYEPFWKVKTIAEALARYPGASILAVKQPDAEVTSAPDQTLRLAPGDLIVSVGPNAVLDRISE